MAFDLTTNDSDGMPWDFDDPIKRQRAWKMITTEKPAVVVGSPMCRHWSAWQNINHMHKDPAVVSRERVRALVHLHFCCMIYEYQVAHGRYFIHEHPAGASSWAEECMERVRRLKGWKG